MIEDPLLEGCGTDSFQQPNYPFRPNASLPTKVLLSSCFTYLSKTSGATARASTHAGHAQRDIDGGRPVPRAGCVLPE